MRSSSNQKDPPRERIQEALQAASKSYSRTISDGEIPSASLASKPQKSKIRFLRVWRRNRVQIDVELLDRTGYRGGVVHDISPYGVGLTGQFDLTTRDETSIRFADGRILFASVRWIRFDSCGISFVRPLDDNDPLLEASAVHFRSWFAGGPVTGRSKLQNAMVLPQIFVRSAKLVVATARRLRGCLSGTVDRLGQRRKDARAQRDNRMLSRACRKQGFAWLVDEVEETDLVRRNLSSDGHPSDPP